MFYSIIPPVLLVLSLIGIIIFLMKKAPAVASLEDEKDFLTDEERNEAELAVRYATLKKENRKSLKKVAGGFFGAGKSILGKINDRAKEKIEAAKLSKKQLAEKETQSDFFQRKKDAQVKITDEEEYAPETAREAALKEYQIAQQEEKEAKPEKKDLFENILIDRIAANPKDIEAYERLGEYYLEIENWNYGKECFKQVLKLNPRNINAKSKMRKLEKVLSRR